MRSGRSLLAGAAFFLLAASLAMAADLSTRTVTLPPWHINNLFTDVTRLNEARPGPAAAAEAGPQKYLHIVVHFNATAEAEKKHKFRVVNERGDEVGEQWGWNDGRSSVIFEGSWGSLVGMYLDGLGHREPLFTVMPIVRAQPTYVAPRPVIETRPTIIAPDPFAVRDRPVVVDRGRDYIVDRGPDYIVDRGRDYVVDRGRDYIVDRPDYLIDRGPDYVVDRGRGVVVGGDHGGGVVVGHGGGHGGVASGAGGGTNVNVTVGGGSGTGDGAGTGSGTGTGTGDGSGSGDGTGPTTNVNVTV
ncbi:MAG: hypothetical protein ABR915_19905, partial [Thermoguttaceae bacterium]